MKICSPNPSSPPAFAPRGGAAWTRLRRRPLPLPRSRGFGPGGPGGEPSKVGLGDRTLGSSPQTRLPASHFWRGRRCSRNPRGQRTPRESGSGRSPDSDSGGGGYFFDSGLRKKFQFEPVRKTRAKLSRSLALAHGPGTAPRACLLPRRASGPRRPAPTFLPPAACRTSRRASGPGEAVRDGNTHLQPSRRAGTRVGPRISTPRPPSEAQLLPSPDLPGGSGGGRCRAGRRRFGTALAGWGLEEEKSRETRRERARARELLSIDLST